MKYVVTINGREIEVSLDGHVASIGSVAVEARVAEVDGTPLSVVTVGDRVYTVIARERGSTGTYVLRLAGFRFDVEALDERTRAIRQLAGAAARLRGPAALAAPMPGLIVRVLVQQGEAVQAGQGLVVIEAMKMENELRASAPGVVRAVRVEPGSAVEKGTLLVEFEADSPSVEPPAPGSVDSV